MADLLSTTSTMPERIATAIREVYDADGLAAAKAKYRSYFVTCKKFYGKYQAECDMILTDSGYAIIIK